MPAQELTVDFCLQKLNEHYVILEEIENDDPDIAPEDKFTKLKYAAVNIFGYDAGNDEIEETFAYWSVKVATAITERKTFEFIEDRKQHLIFLMVIQTAFFNPLLDSGTSVRGSWWSWDDKDFKDNVSVCVDEIDINTRQDFINLMTAVSQFVSEEVIAYDPTLIF